MVERSFLRWLSLPTFAIASGALLLVSACGNDDPVEEPTANLPAEQAPPQPAADPNAPEPDPRFDADGNLLESEDVAFGVKLPLGSELAIEEDERHVYRSTVKVDKVLTYFGPRLLTGEVDQVGAGAAYRGAQVRGNEGGARVDVSITPTRTGSRIEVIKLVQADPSAETRSEDEIRAALEEEMRRLD